MTKPTKELISGLSWGIGAIGIALCFWGGLAGSPLQEYALVTHGQDAPGFLQDTAEESDRADSGQTLWYHDVDYSYTLPDGRAFTAHHKGSGRLKAEFRDLAQPYPIQVEYLPETPQISRIKGSGCQTIFEWVWRRVGLGTLLLVLFTSPGTTLVYRTIREYKKSRAPLIQVPASFRSET